jgi:S1-C subfamily serine protease
LGFAIPIKTAKHIAEELMANGKANHPYLGIRMTTLTPDLKKEINQDPNANLDVKDDRGVLVFKVENSSPAAQGGLKAGDVIKKVGDKAVDTAEQVQQAVEASSVGGNLAIEVDRGGQSMSINVKPGAFPVTAARE